MMPAARRTAERLDVLLLERGLADSRRKAHALVLAGQVVSRGVRLEKPGTRYPVDIPLEVQAGRRHVSRAGPKLEAALAAFDVEVADRETLDVGASTGGFTEVLLRAGARRVVALDVGRGQLDWTLRNDPRVQTLEGLNARYLEPAALPYRPSLAVVDVSFISLELVLPPVSLCLQPGGEIVCLIKPQFEAGRASVGRGGIVRDPEVHREVLERFIEFCRQRWGLIGLCRSPVAGAHGNREFLAHLRLDRPGLDTPALLESVRRVLAEEDPAS